MLRWLGLAVALLLVPTAAGQETGSLELVLSAPAGPIKPEIESPSFTVEVTASCDAILARVDPAAPPEPVPVVLQFVTEAGVVVIGPQAVPMDPQACTPGLSPSVTETATLQLAIPRTAPGLRPLAATAQARLDSTGPATPALQSDVVPFTVTADAYLLSEVKVSRKLQPCDDGKARFDLELTNHGNVRTQYTFDLGSQPSGNDWSATPPDAVVLDSPNGGGGNVSTLVPFVVACPFGNKEASYQLVIRPAAVDDPGKQGDPLTANVLARVNTPLGVPGPGPLVLLALLGLALLARRRA